MFPTRRNVEKILKHFGVSEGLIYLKGQTLHERDDTDVELPFRQESNFFYVTGTLCKKVVKKSCAYRRHKVSRNRISMLSLTLLPDAFNYSRHP